jgi:hypothetical protein
MWPWRAGQTNANRWDQMDMYELGVALAMAQIVELRR